MSPVARYKEFEYFLRLVCRHKQDTIPNLLKSANSDVIRSIVEIAYNIIKGDIPLSRNQIKLFTSEKKNIKYIISKTNTLKQKRLIMTQNPKLVKTMLKIIF